MPSRRYSLDWSRPLTAHLAGERAYHATNGERHILVILTDAQLFAAERLSRRLREEEPETTVQNVVEMAIARAMSRRAEGGGELRLRDEDLE